MRSSLTIIQKNKVHICFTVHVNGASAGSLCLRTEEWAPFVEKMKPYRIYDNTCEICHGAGEVPEYDRIDKSTPMYVSDWKPCPSCQSVK